MYKRQGLEFDEVIIPQTDDKNYHSNIDKSMLYVATTRAMPKLTLTYSVSAVSYTQLDVYKRQPLCQSEDSSVES